MKIEIEVNAKEARLLMRLVHQGIFGLTVEDVAHRLLDRMLWEIFYKPGGRSGNQ